MAQFELTLKESFRYNKDRWPQEFRTICDGLAMALTHLAEKAKTAKKKRHSARLNTLLFGDRSIIDLGRRNVSREPLTATIKFPEMPSVFAGTIPVPDEAAEEFESAFRAIPDVVRVHRVA
jgi:hypothetical protein